MVWNQAVLIDAFIGVSWHVCDAGSVLTLTLTEDLKMELMEAVKLQLVRAAN
jgi:hypothetical protein